MDERVERIISTAKNKGIALTHLAKCMNTYRTKVSEWRNGKSTPTEDEIRICAEALGVSVEYINTGNQDAPTSVTLTEAFRVYAKAKLGHEPSPEELRDIELATDIVVERLKHERK